MDTVSVLKVPILDKGQLVHDLGPQMTEARSLALKSFDKEASRYHAGVYEKKRFDLLKKLNAQLSVYFVGQLRNLHKAAVIMFQDSIKSELKKPSYNFADVVDNATRNAEMQFKEGAQSIILADTDWSYDSEFDQLQEDFAELSAQARSDEIKKMTKMLEKQVEGDLTEPTSLALNNPSSEMWHKILTVYKLAIANGQDTLIKKAKSMYFTNLIFAIANSILTDCCIFLGFNTSDEELDESVKNLVKQSWLLLRRKIDEELADSMVLLKLRSKFEDKFRYDDEGLPKVWKPEDDIDAHFKKAREEVGSITVELHNISITKLEYIIRLLL